MSRLAWFTLAVTLALGASSVALAQDDPRTQFARGQTAYQQGDYDGAIREWTAAYAQDPRPLLQYNLSQAYERLGRATEAAAALERYVATAEPADPNQADARARLAALRERLSSTGIRIQGGPEGATILIDGEDKGRTPRPDAVRVAPGTHRVVVRMAGYDDFNATIVVTAAQVADVSVEMHETQGPVIVHEGGGSPWPFVVMGAGGTFVVVGVVLGIIANGKAGDATFRTGPEADSARRFAIGADVTMGLGLLTAGAGLLWLLLSGGSDEEAAVAAGSAQARLRVDPSFGPTLVGATATVGF